MKNILILLVVLTLLISVAAFAIISARDCKNCGSNCCAGSCDQSSACAQCYIYDCVIGGQPTTLDCGMGCP
jgi:hypothetical protein